MLLTWAEGRSSQRFFLLLGIAWLTGKIAELTFPSPLLWHWHFARLMVMLAAEGWALRRAERWVFPLITTSLVFSVETLFQVNEPGVFPYGAWFFSIALVIVALLTAKTYWGTLAAFVGSVLLNQALVRFLYEGIVSHADFPDPFIWNFGVAFFAVWTGLRLALQAFTARALPTSTSALLLPVNEAGVQEQKEDQDREL
jgi:hypothetical protein